MGRAPCRGHLALRDAALCAALRVRWSESDHRRSSSRCDCQTTRACRADDTQTCIIARVVWPAPGAPVFLVPRLISRGTERREAQRRSLPLNLAAEWSASLPPERDTRALRRSTQPSLRRLGFVMGGDFAPRDRASGARTDGVVDPCGIGPHRFPRALARVRPTPSSPCGRPHLVGADGKPRASRTQGARPARGRRILLHHQDASR